MTTLDRELKRLETLLAQPAERPHLEHLRRVLRTRAVTGSAAQAAALEAVRGELVGWMRALEAEHQALDGLARDNVAAALESQHALRQLMALLEAAWTLVGGASPADVARLQQLASKVEAAFAEAAERISTSTAGLTLRPLACQPVSRSGVRLKPVAPPPRRASTPLPAFKAPSFPRS